MYHLVALRVLAILFKSCLTFLVYIRKIYLLLWIAKSAVCDAKMSVYEHLFFYHRISRCLREKTPSLINLDLLTLYSLFLSLPPPLSLTHSFTLILFLSNSEKITDLFLFTPPPALSEPDRLCAETQESVDELLLRDGSVSAVPSKKRSV